MKPKSCATENATESESLGGKIGWGFQALFVFLAVICGSFVVMYEARKPKEMIELHRKYFGHEPFFATKMVMYLGQIVLFPFYAFAKIYMRLLK